MSQYYNENSKILALLLFMAIIHSKDNENVNYIGVTNYEITRYLQVSGTVENCRQ